MAGSSEVAPGVLACFWQLASDDAAVRIGGVQSLLDHLRKTSNQPSELAYCLKRLVRGLASPRGSARQGFSSALCAVLTDFAKEISTSSVEEMMRKEFAPTSGLKGQEERDLLFAKLFGINALARSRRYEDNGQTVPSLAPTVQEILDMVRAKPFLSTMAGETLLAIASHFSARQNLKAFLFQIRHLLPRSCTDWTADVLAFGIGLQAATGISIAADTEDAVERTTVLHPSNIPLFSHALKESTLHTHPHMHPVWTRIFDFVMAEPTAAAAPLPFSRDAVLFAVWDIVDRELCPSTHERKYLSFSLVRWLVARTTAVPHISTIISTNLLHNLAVMSASKENVLFQAASETIAAIGKHVAAAPVQCRIVVLSKLSAHKKGPILLRNPKMKDLLATPADPSSFAQYTQYLLDAFSSLTALALSKADGSLRQQLHLQQQQQALWIIDQLSNLVKPPLDPKTHRPVQQKDPKDVAALAELRIRILRFFTLHAFFGYSSLSPASPQLWNSIPVAVPVADRIVVLPAKIRLVAMRKLFASLQVLKSDEYMSAVVDTLLELERRPRMDRSSLTAHSSASSSALSSAEKKNQSHKMKTPSKMPALAFEYVHPLDPETLAFRDELISCLSGCRNHRPREKDVGSGMEALQKGFSTLLLGLVLYLSHSTMSAATVTEEAKEAEEQELEQGLDQEQEVELDLDLDQAQTQGRQPLQQQPLEKENEQSGAAAAVAVGEWAYDLTRCCRQLVDPDSVESVATEQGQGQGQVNPMDVLVDTLVALLHKQSVFVRDIVQRSFRFFVGRLTPAGVQILCSMLLEDPSSFPHSAAAASSSDDGSDEDDQQDDSDKDGNEGEDLEEDDDDVDNGDDDEAHSDDGSEGSDSDNSNIDITALREVPDSELASDADDDAEGKDSDEESVTMTDEQMLALDSQLAQVVKQMRQGSASREGPVTRPQDLEEMRRELLLVKFKVLDLVEVLIRADADSKRADRLVLLLEPLIRCCRKYSLRDDAMQKQFLERVHGLLANRLFKAVPSSTDAGDGVGAGLLRKTVQRVVQIALHASSPVILDLCGGALQYLCKVERCASPSGSAANPVVVAGLRRCVADFFGRSNSPLTSKFFMDIFVRFPGSVGWPLAEDVRQGVADVGQKTSRFLKTEGIAILECLLQRQQQQQPVDAEVDRSGFIVRFEKDLAGILEATLLEPKAVKSAKRYLKSASQLVDYIRACSLENVECDALRSVVGSFLEKQQKSGQDVPAHSGGVLQACRQFLHLLSESRSSTRRAAGGNEPRKARQAALPHQAGDSGKLQLQQQQLQQQQQQQQGKRQKKAKEPEQEQEEPQPQRKRQKLPPSSRAPAAGRQ